MPYSSVVGVFKLFELDNKVSVAVARWLVPQLFEDKLWTFIEAGLDLDLLNSALDFDCFGVVLDDSPLILDLLYGPIVQFI